jgi:uncharacterized membrane protein
MLYGIRHFILVLIPIFTSLKGNNSIHSDLSSTLFSPEMLLGDLVILPLLIAWGRRIPEAKRHWKKIWNNGRVILTVGFLIQIILLLITGLLPNINSGFSHNHIVPATIAYMIFNAILVVYIWRTQRIKDVFMEWPEKEDKEIK